jgi:hypothetical protein
MPPDRKNTDRLRKEIVAYLEDFPRQLEVFEAGIGTFGEDFELRKFKDSFEGKDGTEGYLRVQALERGFTRVQNYIAQLAQSGVMLAGLELPKIHEGPAARSFEALKRAGVIDATTCKSLKQTQETRSAVEHDYVLMKAGRLHKSITLLAATARDFIGPYTAWITSYLD